MTTSLEQRPCHSVTRHPLPRDYRTNPCVWPIPVVPRTQRWTVYADILVRSVNFGRYFLRTGLPDMLRLTCLSN